MVLCSTQLFAQDTHDTHALGSVPGGCGREIMLRMHLGMGVDDQHSAVALLYPP